MRILCPTDGSPGAAAALDAVLGTFEPAELTVDLLTVIPSHDGPSSVAGAAAQVDATALLASERTRLDAAGITVETAVRIGHPADEIVAFAATRQPTLVVLGARAQGDGGHAFAAPIANALARDCSASVLIVRHSRPIRAIVLGYDGSRGAEAALSLLTQLPWRAPPRIHVGVAFDVVHPFASGIAPLLRDQVLEATEADLIRSGEMAQATATEASGRLRGGGFPTTAQALHGRPSEQLIVLADETGADMVAVGARGLSGVGRLLLGSTSAELAARASTSLLVVRTDAS